jgi:hypothetical protein
MLSHLRFCCDPYEPRVAFQRFGCGPELAGITDASRTQLVEIAGFSDAFPHVLEELAHFTESFPGFRNRSCFPGIRIVLFRDPQDGGFRFRW